MIEFIYERKFKKDISNIRDKKTLGNIKEFIINAKIYAKNDDIQSIFLKKKHIKIRGYKNYYRIRFGDYRLGFEIEKQGNIIVIKFIRFLHRKYIYKNFP
ncbi:MAG: type II toxin-antitoxin system RelE/ParE family toxin [Bacteroidales bacterium]|nr:type II toxin-antitoxin system RelE/ParE family toxin [Bacteroidales bacterium]